jgi:hypothetical protein
MIIWIASYPRSGNTLMRMILNRCFEVVSHSVYDHIESDAMVPVTGHVFHAMDTVEFIEKARASPLPFFIKTHEMPPAADDLAIYIVRDGRAALESHRRYLKDIARRNFPLEYLALGAGPVPAWSDHVLAWTQRPSGNLLVLHYEQLVRPDEALLARISEFVRQPVRHPFDLKFSDLRAIDSRFFRFGRNEPGIQALEAQCANLFWAVNHKGMERLGYGVPPALPDPIPEALLAQLRLALTRTRQLALQENSPPSPNCANPDPAI